VDNEPETFAAWRERTTPQTRTRAWVVRLFILLAVVAFVVLLASDHLGWAILIALVAATLVWASERAPFLRH
jgi:hypothetical protein